MMIHDDLWLFMLGENPQLPWQVPRLVEDGPERSWPKVGLQDHGSWPWKDSSTMLVYLPLG